MNNNKKSNLNSNDKTRKDVVSVQDSENTVDLIEEDLDAVQGGAAPILGPKN